MIATEPNSQLRFYIRYRNTPPFYNNARLHAHTHTRVLPTYVSVYMYGSDNNTYDVIASRSIQLYHLCFFFLSFFFPFRSIAVAHARTCWRSSTAFSTESNHILQRPRDSIPTYIHKKKISPFVGVQVV